MAKITIRLTSLSAGALYDTPAKLTAFFKVIGFEPSKGGGGRLSTLRPVINALKALKGEWDQEREVRPTYGDGLVFTNRANPDKTFTIDLPLFKGGFVSVKLDKSKFTAKDAVVNIYNVTKYHPAWMWVTDELDDRGTNMRNKATVKEAVDRFMMEQGMNASDLMAQIVQRTRDKDVHPLYGTD